MSAAIEETLTEFSRRMTIQIATLVATFALVSRLAEVLDDVAAGEGELTAATGLAAYLANTAEGNDDQLARLTNIISNLEGLVSVLTLVHNLLADDADSIIMSESTN